MRVPISELETGDVIRPSGATVVNCYSLPITREGYRELIVRDASGRMDSDECKADRIVTIDDRNL